MLIYKNDGKLKELNGLNETVNIEWTGKFEEIKADDINIDSLISSSYPLFHLNKKARAGNNFAHPLTYFSSYLGNNNTSLIYGTEIRDLTYGLEGNMASGYLHIPQENTAKDENITNVNDNTIRFFQNFSSFEEMKERTNLFQFFNLNEYAIGYKNKNPMISNKPSFSLIHNNNVSMDKNLFGYDQVIIKSEEHKENDFDLTEEEAVIAKKKMENLVYYDKEDISVTDQSYFKYEYLYDEDSNVVSAIIAGFNDNIQEPIVLVIPHHISYEDNDLVEIIGIKDWAFGFETYEEYNQALCSDENASGGFRVVYIPNTIKYIGNMAFANRYTEASNGLYYGMEKIKLSKKLSYIGLDAFYGCQLLHEKNYQTDYVIGNEEDIWFNKEKTILIKYPKTKEDESYNIPDTVTEIADFAFYGCNNLTNIIIPKSISKIGQYAFSNCTGLSNVYYYGNGKEWDNITIFDENSCLTDKITTIINDEIWERFNIYCTYDDNGRIVSCDNTIVGEIILPDIINGKRITRIGYGAFKDCFSLTGVTIPESTTSIEEDAFLACHSLTSIIIPDSVTNIKNYAFAGCTSLTSITIPNSVTSIGAHAFSSCNNIEKITIGEKVTTITSCAFDNCTGLTQIEWNAKNVSDFPAGNCVFSHAGQNSDGIDVVFGDNVERIPAYCFYPSASSGYTPKIASITIGNSVTSIGKCGFYDCRNLKSIIIPENVTGIGEYAFRYCTGLTNVTIGKGVTSIGGYAFQYCESLTSIKIPNSVIRIGGWAFGYCTSLASAIFNLNMNDANSYMGGSIFSHCENLKNIVIGQSITCIEACMFDGCSNLTNVIMPNSIKSIKSSAFRDCNPKNIYYGGKAEEYSKISIEVGNTGFENGTKTYETYCDCIFNELIVSLKNGKATIIGFLDSNIQQIIIPDIIEGYPVTSIENYAFSSYDSLTSVTIGDSVTYIGNYAFKDCTSLTSITIPDSVTYIDGGAFKGCNSLIELTMPKATYGSYEASRFGWIFGCEVNNYVEGTTYQNYSNGSSTYYYYIPSSLKKVTITGGEIDISAFYNCKDLTNVIIGDSVTSIGYGAFQYCESLTSVTIGNSVTSIEDFAFYECHNLTSITIPDSVTYIGNYAFYYCSSLTSVYYNGTEEDWNSISIFNDNTSLKNAKKYFISTIPLNYITYSIENGKAIINDIDTSIDGWVEIPSTLGSCPVTSIGDEAFYECHSLTSIIIPDSVTHIGNFAFAFCSNLTNITLPDSVTSIDDYAFYSCTSLTSVTIPDSVTSIGNSAFNSCYSLTTIKIPDSITSIGMHTFDGTAYYNNSSNWANDVLYINNHLIAAKSSISGNYTIKENTLTIGDDAFSFCTSLTNITIPDSVTSIGDSAFRGCTELTSVIIPDSVISIGAYAFDSCRNLTNIIIPNNVISINEYAFQYCENLISIKIPDSVTNIGEAAFGGCSSLLSIAIPSSVTSIGNFAFGGCTSLTSVIMYNNINIGENAFYNIGENATIQYWGYKDDWSKYSISGDYEIICILDDPWYYKVNLEDFPILDRGMCGENVYWTIHNNNDKYILQIFGKGTASNWTELNSLIKENNISCFEECYLSCANIELGEFIEDIYIKKYVVHDDSQQYSSDDDGVLYSRDKSILYKYPVDINKGFGQISEVNADERIIILDSVRTISENAFNDLFKQKLATLTGDPKCEVINIQIQTNDINIKDDTLKSCKKFLPDIVWINYSFNNNGNVACHVLNYLKTNYDNLQNFKIYNGDCFYYSFSPYTVEMGDGKCSTALYCGISTPNQFKKAVVYIEPHLESNTGDLNITLETIFDATKIYGLSKNNNTPIELNKNNYQINFIKLTNGSTHVVIEIDGMDEAPEILLFSFPYNKFKTPNYCINKIEGYFDTGYVDATVEVNTTEECLKKQIENLEYMGISNNKTLGIKGTKLMFKLSMKLTTANNKYIWTLDLDNEIYNGCYVLFDFEKMDIKNSELLLEINDETSMKPIEGRANVFLDEAINSIKFISNQNIGEKLENNTCILLYKKASESPTQ